MNGTKCKPLSRYVELFNQFSKTKINLDMEVDLAYIEKETQNFSRKQLVDYREPYQKAWLKDFTPFQTPIKAVLTFLDKQIVKTYQTGYAISKI